LLSQRGEASGAQVARELHDVLRALDADDRHSFQRYLATEFPPDKAALRTAAERYLADGTAEAAAALARAADPPRQELLRRMNMPPGGTGALIAMRSEIASCLRGESPSIKLLDQFRADAGLHLELHARMQRGEAAECRRQRAAGDLLDHAKTHRARQPRRRQAMTGRFLKLQQATCVAEQHLAIVG
jgi:hypothetical protein